MKNIVISNNEMIWSKEHKNILLGEWCLEGIEKNFNSKKLNYEIQERVTKNLMNMFSESLKNFKEND